MNVFRDLPKLLWSMGGMSWGFALPLSAPLAMPLVIPLVVPVGVSLALPAKAESMPMRVSWYGPGFDGGYTASGEIFDRYDYTAAHPTWPFGTILQLTHPDTGDSVTVRVNDRSGGALDISEQAARDLGTYSEGIVPVEVEIIEWGEQAWGEPEWGE